MKRLREKLHSQRGASLIMALLLFLVCCMVAASILAAAAANAGKYRSNQVEQQKYLTLSSAIQRVADEIQKAAKYTGKYEVYEWTVTTEVTDEEGNVIDTIVEEYFHVEQVKGEYECGDLGGENTGNPAETPAVIPLLRELDAIFSKQFVGSGYEPLSDGDIEEASIPHDLTVTLPDDLTGYPYPDPSGLEEYQVDKTVTVRVKLDHATHHITLTAWLGTGAEPPEDKSDTMIAELVSKITKKGTGELVTGTLALDYSPGGREGCGKEGPSGPPGSIRSGGKVTEPDSAVVIGAPMRWELHWIKKGTA